VHDFFIFFLDCPLGYFVGTSAAVECSECPVRSYQNNLHSASCLTCVAGSITNVDGNFATVGGTSCTPCAKGKSSPTSSTDCVACPRSRYATTTGNSLCQECAAGSITKTEGNHVTILGETCEKCPAGKRSTNGNVCSDCSIGKFSIAAGTESCLDCSVGSMTTSDGTTYTETGGISCLQCSYGTYSQSPGAACKQCPHGSTTRNAANARATAEGVACVACSTGTYSQGNLACADCTSNGRTPTDTLDVYQSSGATACSSCEAGKKTNGAESCSTCTLGKFATALSRACTRCGNGNEPLAVGGLNVMCSPCPQGTFRKSGSVNDDGYCKPCPSLKVAPNQGQTSCNECPSNMIFKSATEPCETAVESLALITIAYTTSNNDTPQNVVEWVRDASETSVTAILVASSTSGPENYFTIESATYNSKNKEVVMLLWFATTGAASQIQNVDSGAFVIGTVPDIPCASCIGSKLKPEASSVTLRTVNIESRAFPKEDPTVYQPTFIHATPMIKELEYFTYGQNVSFSTQSSAIAYQISLRDNNDDILTTLCVGVNSCVNVQCLPDTFIVPVRSLQESAMSKGICRGRCDISAMVRKQNKRKNSS